MKNYKAILKELGLDFKKELIIYGSFVGVIVIASVLLGVFVKWMFGLIGLPFIAVYSLFFFTRYKGIKKKREKEMQNELVYVLSYFKIYLQNGFSVYSAIKEVLSFASKDLKALLEQLLADIDVDKTVEPFVKFAKHFEALAVEQLMISIYQLIDEGSKAEYLHQFELIFNDLANDLHASYLIKKDQALQSASMFPLFGAGMLIIIITMGIIGVIGDMVNGL